MNNRQWKNKLGQRVFLHPNRIIRYFILFLLIMGGWLATCFVGSKVLLKYYSFDKHGDDSAGQIFVENPLTDEGKRSVAVSLSGLIRAALCGSAGKNSLCFPVNDYLLLTAAAECASDEDLRSILDLLGATDLCTLEANAVSLYSLVRGSEKDRRIYTSLWLDHSVSLSADAMESLAGLSYMECFRGDFESVVYRFARTGWLSQTKRIFGSGHLAQGKKEETVLFYSAIDIKAKWSRFSLLDSTKRLFYTETGNKELTFISARFNTCCYYLGDSFDAAAVFMDDGRSIWFLLPKKGLNPEALAAEMEFQSFLEKTIYEPFITNELANVSIQLPRISYRGENGLAARYALGGDVYASQTEEKCRLTQPFDITIDERGINRFGFLPLKTSHTHLMGEKDIDISLNRPFLYLILGEDSLPVAAGTVYEP